VSLRPGALAAALVKVGLEEEEIHPARVTGPLVVGRVLTRVEEAASSGLMALGAAGLAELAAGRGGEAMESRRAHRLG